MATFASNAELLRDTGEQQIAQHLNDSISRAFLLEEPLRAMALDFNAHLVTELRVRKIWPAKGETAVEEDAA